MAERLSFAVGELAGMAAAEFSVDELLALLCQVASKAVNADGVGVTKVDHGAGRFVQASGPVFGQLEQLQEALQDGPGRSAIDTGSMICASSPAQMAWPAFEELAVQIGIRAVMAVPLISRGRSWGSLDLYWQTDHIFTERDKASAVLLAHVAVSYLVQAEDRTEARRVQEQLTHKALHDELTGLPNRTLLQELTYHALTSAKRRGTVVAILFLDVDHFKSVNDSFGHRAGDQVLRVIAQRMTNLLREGDTVARLSGDEFLILCEDIDAGEHAVEEIMAVADRMRLAVGEPISLHRTDSERPGSGQKSTLTTVKVSVSVGAAFTNRHQSSAELIHLADSAMYKAKAQGGDRVVLHLEQRADANRRHKLEQRLFHAADRGELDIHYQPVVDPTGRIAAFEALVRWQHPDLGLLNAAEFVDLAQATGSIVSIGHWVINQALQQLSQWKIASPDTFPPIIFINLSPRELISPDLPETLETAVNKYKLQPENVGIEILENDLADLRLAAVLTLLQQRGHPLAIDDFGSGYSSLSRLLDLPVNYIKIDRSLTAKLPSDLRSRAMIKAVVALANDLDMQVISEGVETRAQAEHLIAAGSHLLQGFHYARPMSADEAYDTFKR